MLTSRTILKIGLVALVSVPLMGMEASAPSHAEKVKRSGKLIALLDQYNEANVVGDFLERLKVGHAILDTLDEGVDLNVHNEKERLPLVEAIRYGLPFIIIQQMIGYQHKVYQQEKTDVNQLDRRGFIQNVPLGMMVYKAMGWHDDPSSTQFRERMEAPTVVKELLANGANPRAQLQWLGETITPIEKAYEIAIAYPRNEYQSEFYHLMLDAAKPTSN
jgi:hypothetical protein